MKLGKSPSELQFPVDQHNRCRGFNNFFFNIVLKIEVIDYEQWEFNVLGLLFSVLVFEK